MDTFQPAEKIAVLLSLLGEDAVKIACQDLDASSASFIRRALDDFQESPPTEEQIMAVVDDFEQFFQKSLANSDKDDSEDESARPTVSFVTEDAFEVQLDPVKSFAVPVFTGDVRVDLNRMHPYQVAMALSADEPKTVAVVLKNLATEHAAKTLELLPDSIRSDVFLELSNPLSFSKPIQARILEAALEGAKKVSKRADAIDSTDQIISIVRTMPKPMRGSMMEQLMEANEELAKTVKAKMFRFEDLLDLEDRAVQKILGQSKTDDLVVALQQCDEDLLQHVLGNMSKRARQTIEDEMEFKAKVQPDEIAESRRQIVEIIVKLEESGEISVE